MTAEQYETMLREHRLIRTDLMTLSHDSKQYRDKMEQLRIRTIALKEYVAKNTKLK